MNSAHAWCLFRALADLPEKPTIVAVDVPIGLPDVTQPGGRTCERLAREMVGANRARSVFSAVGRIALRATSRVQADRLSRTNGEIGVGAQAWGLAKKLLEADAVMTPVRQQVIREVHPELSFPRWRVIGHSTTARRPLPARGNVLTR